MGCSHCFLRWRSHLFLLFSWTLLVAVLQHEQHTKLARLSPSAYCGGVRASLWHCGRSKLWSVDSCSACRAAPVELIDTNELIVAIEMSNEEEASRLLEGPEAPRMLRARSPRGLTPLMLAAMGRCSEELAKKMLVHGPEVAGVSLRSRKGKTAAYYAELHAASAAFLAQLRSLERQELERTASVRCQVCGVPIARRPKLAELVEQCRCGAESNALVARFFGNDLAVASLLQPHFHTLNNDEKCRKKLSQSLAVLGALERAVPDLASWHIVDLCCGKSLTSSLAALQHPESVVTAVDRLARSHLPHFDEAGITNVRYLRLNVLADSFVSDLAHAIRAVARPTVVLGMHLCGRLSERAIEVFRCTDLVRVCILSPCCLPHLDDAPPSLVPLYRTGASDEEQYAAWGLHLEQALGAEPGAAVESEVVPDILSVKRTVLTATKSLDIGLWTAGVAEAGQIEQQNGFSAEFEHIEGDRTIIPARLFVASLFGTGVQRLCSGEYQMVVDENRMLLWRHASEDRWLHRGSDDLWYISGCGSGDFRSEHCVRYLRHPVRCTPKASFPHELVGSWERYDESRGEWKKDSSIIVSVTPRSDRGIRWNRGSMP